MQLTYCLTCIDHCVLYFTS